MSSRVDWARRLLGTTLVGVFFVAACGGGDGAAADDDEAAVCGDGVVGGGEQCDGNDFAATCADFGFDEGPLTCTADCMADASACVILDEDADGLNIYDEQALGTDPLIPDSDTDGVMDGDEFAYGSDPLNLYSWPQGIGAWPNRLAVGQAEGLVGEGWQMGQQVPNFAWIDQFGRQVDLHQFYGYVTVLSIGATWCPPCKEASSTAQQLWEQHRDNGVIFLEQLAEGPTPGVPATPNDVANWTNTYGLQFPVMSSDFPIGASSLPTFYIFDRSMRVVQKIEGYPGDPAISAAIANAMQ